MVSPSLHPPQYNSPAGGFSPHWPGCSRHMFFPHWPGCSRHIISIRVPLTGYDAAQKGEISKRLVISSFCAARATSRATIPSFQSTHSSQSETIAADRTVSPTHYVATPLHQLQRGDIQKPQLLLVRERQQSLDLLGQDRSVFHSYLQNSSCLEASFVVE